VPEYEELRPCGRPAAVARLTLAASECGLIRPGDKLDRNVIEFGQRVVEMCTSIGDRYFDHRTYESAGAQIWAELTEC